MEKLYCKVQFSFGMYTFHTMISTLIKGDKVLCKVKSHFQIGNFVEYCKKPEFGTVPCYGEIDHVIQNHEEMEEQYRKQHEEYCPAIGYVVGDEVTRNGAVWRMEKDRCFHFVRLV